MASKIIRDGKEIVLTDKEVRNIVDEWQHRCDISMVESFLDDCGFDPDKIDPQIINEIANTYRDRQDYREQFHDEDQIALESICQDYDFWNEEQEDE